MRRMRRMGPGLMTRRKPHTLRTMRGPSVRRPLGIVVALVATCGLGCDAGGLLLVQSTTLDGGANDAGPPGPSVTEIVNAGTVATSGKFKIVYTLGQPTPNQGPVKSGQHRDNGGLVGAMNGPGDPGP